MNKNKLFSMIDKACFDYNLIEKGDRILVGASGGKDSTALIEYFSNRMKRPDAGFSFTALNIHSDFAEPVPEKILEMFREWNVDYKEINVNILGRLKDGKKMNCWWCSTQRRTELKEYAVKNGYNKIALGHHLDDVLETLLMNAVNKSEISTMIPSLKYEKYPVTVIRPLYYAPVEEIVKHAEEKGYLGFTCTCDYQENSERKEARKKLEFLTSGDPVLKEHLFKAICSINLEYLPHQILKKNKDK